MVVGGVGQSYQDSSGFAKPHERTPWAHVTQVSFNTSQTRALFKNHFPVVVAVGSFLRFRTVFRIIRPLAGCATAKAVGSRT